MDTATTETLTQALAHFTGTETWYRHGIMRRVLYTEGIQYLAEHAGAYWLLDTIAFTQRTHRRVQAAPFQAWTLTRTQGKASATLTCDDGNGHVLRRERIPYTDFPLDTITLYCAQDGGERVLMLTSEY